MPGNIVAINSDHLIMSRRDMIQAGLVKGVSLLFAMGERASVGTIVTGEDVWRGNDLNATPAAPASTTELPTPADAGEQLTMFCNSVNDTSAGSGIQKIRLFYLDANGIEQQEDIITNGAAEVDTVATNIRYLQDYCAIEAGAGGVAAGNIRFYKKGSNTIVYGMIGVGGNKSLVPHRMVPAGKVLRNIAWHSHNSVAKRVITRLRADAFMGVRQQGVFCFMGSAALSVMSTPMVPIAEQVPAFSIIKASAWPEAVGGADVSLYWEGELHTL